MVKVNEIKGRMVIMGYTQEKLAKKLGISAKTLCQKMKKGKFDSDEMVVMIDVLEITNPNDIFFAKSVT